ncbi:hypothetical protein Bhyg_17419, partial [Pseudolycoriella hygida]
MPKKSVLVTFLGVVCAACLAVRITNIKVPATYTIDAANQSDMLVLDCDYDHFSNETGFVLKWLFNDIPIYQWIPSQKPFALPLMKGLVNLTYVASSETFFRHKALWISKISWNLTGEYTCHVQTFQSTDKKSAKLQIIVPERKLELRHKTDDKGVVTINCIVKRIFPEPKIIVELQDKDEYRKVDIIDIRSEREFDGLYNVEVERD